MKRPLCIRAVNDEVEHEWDIVREPARFEGKFELVPVIDASVEIRFGVS